MAHSRPEHGYADPDTGEILPTWDQALDQVDNDPDAKPTQVVLVVVVLVVVELVGPAAFGLAGWAPAPIPRWSSGCWVMRPRR